MSTYMTWNNGNCLVSDYAIVVTTQVKSKKFNQITGESKILTFEKGSQTVWSTPIADQIVYFSLKKKCPDRKANRWMDSFDISL